MDNLLALLTALGGLAGLAGLVTALASARNAVRQSDLQALRDTIAALEAENTRLRACIEALEADRDADRRKIADLAGLVTALTAARNAVRQSDLQALRDTIAALEAENTRLRACIEALESGRDANRIKNSLINCAWRSRPSADSTVSRTISLIDLP